MFKINIHKLYINIKNYQIIIIYNNTILYKSFEKMKKIFNKIS